MRSAIVPVALSLALLIPRPSLAQSTPEPTDEQRQAAREAYSRGQALYREGRYEDSVAAFEEAYSLIPNPVVLLGIAQSRRGAGDIAGAIEALERYLAERPSAPDRADIEARLEQLRAMPGTLVVRTEPSGATLLVDGEERGVTPAELELAPGSHRVALTAEGHAAQEQTIELAPGGRQELALTLAEQTVASGGEGLEGEGAPIPEAEVDAPEAAASAAEGPSGAVWATSGLAAASLIGGTVLGFMSLSREAEFDDDPREKTADQGERFALFADVLFGLAAVSAITAVVLFLTDEDDDTQDANATLRVAPVLAPRAGGVTAELRF